jgi:hypothetical protein
VIPTQEDFQFDLTERVRSAVQATIQVVLDEELERLVGAGPYERSDQRVDVRNGRYDRHVVTTAGDVAVRVGRTRAGGAATAPLGRYARRQAEVDDAVTEAYVRGVSTRDMAGVTEALLGTRIGKSTVSRVTKRLEDQVEDLRRERITEPFAYLYLDATFIDARWARSVENVSALPSPQVRGRHDRRRRLRCAAAGARPAAEDHRRRRALDGLALLPDRRDRHERTAPRERASGLDRERARRRARGPTGARRRVRLPVLRPARAPARPEVRRGHRLQGRRVPRVALLQLVDRAAPPARRSGWPRPSRPSLLRGGRRSPTSSAAPPAPTHIKSADPGSRPGRRYKGQLRKSAF